MVTIEEIILKLGLDHDPVTKNAYKAERAIEDIGKTTHKSFLHGTTAAKGFHKVMEELRTQVPVLGNLMNIAFSPIGGTLALVAGGISLAASELKKWEEGLNKIRDSAAKTTTDYSALARAVADTTAAVEKESRVFDDAQRAKGATSDAATIGAAAGKLPPGPAGDMARRKFLEAAREALLKKAQGASDARDLAEKDAKVPWVARSIDKVAKMIASLTADIAPLETGRAANLETIVENQLAGGGAPQRRRETAKAEARLADLAQKKALLERLQNKQRELLALDVARKEELKARQSALGNALDQQRTIETEIGKLPPRLFFPSAAQRGSLMGPWPVEQFPFHGSEANTILRQILREVSDRGVRIEDVRIP